MSHRWRLLCTAAALSVVGCGGPQLPASAASPLLGRALPSMSERAIDGAPIDPASLAGKTVVVKFFAQYCEPCTRTLPVAQGLSTERPDVVIIGVALDDQESVVRGMIATYGLTFPVIHDRGRTVAGRFRVSDIPATFVAGPDGKVRWFGGPGQPPLDVERAVDALAR